MRTVPGTVRGAIDEGTRKATSGVIATAILNAIWAGILRGSPKAMAGAIFRLVAASVCGPFLGAVCGATRKAILAPVSAVVRAPVREVSSCARVPLHTL